MREFEDGSADVVGGDEVLLPGGRLTKDVVRVGDTVRRPAGGSSEFVGRLLRHLEALEVSWAPRYLGRDDRGRDMFTYIAGWVPRRWRSFGDDQVTRTANLLRAFHDATRGSELAGDRSVVCHNDFGPNNAVFAGEHPVAIIDFDMAAPGDPLEDLGYTAWAWCVSSKENRQPARAQARQVRVLADAYGGLDAGARSTLVDAILERQERNVRFWSDTLSNPDGVATSVDKILEIIDWSRRELAYTTANRRHFEAALR